MYKTMSAKYHFRIYTALKNWHHKISKLRIRSLWFVTDSRGLCFHTEYNNKGSSKRTVLLYDASSFNKIKRYMQSQADFINAHDDNYFYVEQRWPGFYFQCKYLFTSVINLDLSDLNNSCTYSVAPAAISSF